MKINPWAEDDGLEIAFIPESWYTDEEGVTHFTDVKLQYVSIDRERAENINITIHQLKNAEELMKKLDKEE